LQEVSAAAERAVKDLAEQEKQLVSLEEKKKHLSTKRNKMSKALTTVCNVLALAVYA
jgi:hypothetical protein